MKNAIILMSLISLYISKIIPHFIFDGIESYHDCSEETEIISFSIYGTLTEEINFENIKVDNYLIEDMGEFECYLKENQNSKNKKRKHKIYCSIKGFFERKGYILVEPKVSGFDFNKENGETSWPTIPERKTFLIGKCGKKIEIDDEPLLLVSKRTSYFNPINEVRKIIIDQILEELPKRNSLNETSMCSSMKKAQKLYSLNEAESAYLIYKWIAQNIVYDCYALNNGGIDYSEKGTYLKGKGVCAGYSSIFETMCNSLGLEAEYVIGYSKGAGFVQGIIPKESDHAWNSVKIDGSYYLVDVTWGSGTCDGDNYIVNFRDFYFCTNPEIFIRTHLPEEKKWQLTSTTIDLKTFVNILKLSNAFYENSFYGISPDTSIISSTGKFKVRFKYDDSNGNIALINNLDLFNGNTYIEQENSCFYTKGKGIAEITCATNYQGLYILRIYGGVADFNKSYPQLVKYIVKSEKDAEILIGFPTIYNLYSNSDMQLIEPLYNPLTRGIRYNFKVKTSTYNNLHLIIGNSHFQEMDNNGNGLFIADSIYIHGDGVGLATLINSEYSYILSYSTVSDPNSAEEPTFPSSYSSPKNILYSPLTNSLKKGKSYEFKIKCELVNDMVVVDGNNFIHLKRKGDIFSGTIKIKGNNGKIHIASYSNSCYNSFYIYDVY